MEILCVLQNPKCLGIYHLALYRKFAYPCSKPAVLKVWSLDQQQQHRHPVGTCYKCRFLDPTRDFDTLKVGPNLWTSPPGDFDACCILRITAIGQWLNPIKEVEIRVKLITDL